MSRYAWLTPDTASSPAVCRVLFIPADIVPHVSGALLLLTEARNWEEHGVTVDDTLAMAGIVWESWEQARSACMIGSILPFMVNPLPDYVLPCDGGVYNRVDYPDLYSALDPVFIVDANTFNTPDLRGKTVIGAGQGVGLTNRVIGASGGSEAHTLTVNEMPIHAHPTHGHDPNLDGEQAGLPDVSAGIPIPGVANSGNSGGDQPHNNMQPFSVLTYGVIAR